MIPRARFRLVPFLSITVLTIVACEATLRFVGFLPRYAVEMTGVPRERATLKIELVPAVLYRLLPDRALGVDGHGYRNLTNPAGYPSSRRTVALLGDSIVMGMAVEERETMARRLATELGSETGTLNFGVQGYGPDQALWVLENDVLALTPRDVVLVLYPENDFSDLMRNDLVRVGPGGEAMFRDDNVVARLLPRVRLRFLWNLLVTGHFLAPADEARIDELLFQDRGEILSADSTEGRALLRAVLQGFAHLCARERIPLTIVVVPGVRELRGWHAGTVDALRNVEVATEVIRELGLPLLDLSEWRTRTDFEDLYTTTDLHLSAKGHAEVARDLAKRLSGER